MEHNKIRVNTSEYAIGQAPQVMVTYGLGSCVAICLYDEGRKVGALLHVMLPQSSSADLQPLRFADTALKTVIAELQKQNVMTSGLAAKLVGGAQLFKSFDSTNSLGARNVAAAEQLLGGLGIPVVSRDVGGNIARSLEFDLSTGLVTIYTKD